MNGWQEDEIKNKDLMASCGLYCATCGAPLIRGAQRCRSCKRPVADELDGTL